MDERRSILTRVGTLQVRVVGTGPVAVLWHSLFVDDRSWGRVEAELSRDRRLVLVTGPGHGASSDTRHRYSLDTCARAAIEILDALGISEPVDWVGNAWGGHVGIVFAATWPERCRTLVTLGTPAQAYGTAEKLQLRLLLGVYLIVGMVDPLARAITDALLSQQTRSSDPDALALVVDSLRNLDRRHLVNAMLSISLGRPDLAPRLASVRCPTLFVTGSDHPEWTPEQAQAASSLLADGASAVVPDTAYLVPLEAPEATIQLVRGVWARRIDSTTFGSSAADKVHHAAAVRPIEEGAAPLS